jgi:hypothetical protein
MVEEGGGKLQNCHSEGGVCPRNLLFSWHLRKSGSLASLGMAKKPTYSAACEAVPYKDSAIAGHSFSRVPALGVSI